MKQEDFELIKEEFNARLVKNMKPIVLTEALINELFDNYNIAEFVEVYYDNKDDKRDISWMEPFEEGIWNMSMKQVRQEARNRLMDRITISSKEPRFYISRTGACVELYYYSRDEEQLDMWFEFLIDRER